MPIQRGLGKGLSSLIPNKNSNLNSETKEQSKMPVGVNQVLEISPEKIKANPYQPRTNFEAKSLKELANSIKAHGILTPLIVTNLGDGQYELISGERRLRAAQDLGLDKVPVIVRQAKNQQKLELSLIENIQREDLNPIELAKSYKRFLDEFNLTQDNLADRVSKSRSQVANTLRFLSLPEQIQDSLAQEEISPGHAKVILSLDNPKAQLNLWKKITLNNFTVRAAESEVRKINVKKHKRKIKVKDAQIVSYEEKLEQAFGTKVQIQGSLKKGKIILEYFSHEELKNIIDNLS